MEKRFSDEDQSDIDSIETNDLRYTPKPWCRLTFLIVALGTLLVLASYTFVTLLSDSRSGKVPDAPVPQFQGGSEVVAHCGTTPQEAQERGCFWDILSFGWSHPDCFDKEESDRWFAEYGPWEWHMGPEKPSNLSASQPLSLEELPYAPVVWTTQGYHIVHCLYVLKMIHVAGMRNASVTNEGIELGHTEHCIKLVGNPEFVDYGTVNTIVHLLFVQCVTLT